MRIAQRYERRLQPTGLANGFRIRHHQYVHYGVSAARGPVGRTVPFLGVRKMSKHFLITAAIGLLPLVSIPVMGQSAAKAPSQGIPRMPDGKPNLQGVWQHPYVPDMSKDRLPDQKGAGDLPFTAAGADNFKNYDVSKFDYTGHCLPFGLMRSMNVGGYPIQFMQNETYVALLFEQ